MGVEIKIDGLTKSFGKQLIWGDVTLTVPAGEICVMLGPSGTGKSVLLKTLIGLLEAGPGLGRHRGHRHHQLPRARAVRDPQALRRPVPGRRHVRLDEPLRQRRLPAARAHQEVGVGDPRRGDGEDGPRRPDRSRDQAARRDLRRHAQAGRPGPRPRARPGDRAVRRARLGARPGAHVVPQPADRRPQRPDRRDVPDRHPRHQHRAHRARQHRPALPPPPGDVRAARDAAQLRGAGRPAVPQRPDHRPDRDVGGEGRRRPRRRGRSGAAAAAAHPVAAGAVQRDPPSQPAPAGRVVPARTASPLLPGRSRRT